MSLQRSACQGPSLVLGQEPIEQIGNAVGDQQIGSNAARQVDRTCSENESRSGWQFLGDRVSRPRPAIVAAVSLPL